MLPRTKKILPTLIAIFTIVSCDNLLNVEPQSSISNEVVFQDAAGANGVLNGTYDVLQDINYYGRDLIIVPEVFADNCIITNSNSNRFLSEWNNISGAHFSFWNEAYDLINRTNHIITKIDNVADLSEEEKKQILGEAYFLRALAYHDLVRSYARNPQHILDGFDLGVPVITEPFDGILDEDAYPSRSTVAQVYTQVKSDLDNAISNFSDTPVNFPFRGSKIAAQALLARVYLYEGSYQAAAAMATTVIDNAPVNLTNDGNYFSTFSDAAESLFEIRIIQAESFGNTSLSSLYGRSPIEDLGYGDIAVSQDIYNEYEPGDVRTGLFRPYVKNGQNIFYQDKYRGYEGDWATDDVIIIRLSEIYLIRAEANYMDSGTDVGQSPLNDVNDIRTNRGLTSIAATGQQLADAIARERRLELAFEGHRSFDLKRKGVDWPKPFFGNAIPYEDYRVVAPIPVNDIDANENIEQNPGY